MSRWTRFFLAILAGVLAGLFYGWFVSPVEYVDTTLESLRIDYKTDYVLMVAETFNVEKDPAMAARRLARLGPESPGDLIRKAVLFAEREGYPDADVAHMRSLGSAMEVISPPEVQGQTP